MDNKILLDIFAQDKEGLLDTEEKQTVTLTEDDRLVASFQEINSFITEHGREPKSGEGVNEHQLYRRLETIRDDPVKREAVQKYDQHNLLTQQEVYESLDDIFAADTDGLLDEPEDSIFNLRHVPLEKETNMPDYVAQRKPCKDFDEFEHLFKQCHRDMVKGYRSLIDFKQEQQIEAGQYFILKRVMVYIAHVGERIVENGQKTNARLRCIFENGTESDMLLRSLAAELYKDGKRVTDHKDNLMAGFAEQAQPSLATGFIYVAKSLSTHPEIANRKSLYKIGFTRNKPEQRVQNSQNDPTFLNAPVEIVAIYECHDLNTQKLETNLHRLFSEVCLNVEINGYYPREWFVVPLSVINDAIDLLINGNIVNYHYDAERGELVLK